MEGQKIPPPDGHFTSLAICRCLAGQGRALGPKEPRSLPGSQALGPAREPALLHSWRGSHGGHIWDSVSGAMICRESQSSQPAKPLQARVSKPLGALQGLPPTRADGRAAPLRGHRQP